MRRLFGVLLRTPYLVYPLRPLMSTLEFRSLVEMCELNWQISLTPRTVEIWKLGLSVDIRYPRQWAPHTSTPLKRDLIPEDVSHVGGLSLIISPTRDRMGLAPWREVQSLCERTKYTRKLPSLWTALWLYRLFYGRRSHELQCCVTGRNDLTLKSSHSTEGTDAEIILP
jgi:hypothetical protein